MAARFPSVTGLHTPNFYVRALSGKAWATATEVSVTNSDLAAVMAALRTFATVLVLEASDFGQRMAAIAGCAGNETVATLHESNSHVPLPADVAAQADNLTFYRLWRRHNALDIALYEWVNKTFG